ncbi:MAG: hypothetical protein R2831_10610 [Chitinophagaceae bacterium]
MELLEFPDNEIWIKRNKWIEDEIENSMTGFSYLVSDQATALFYDLQALLFNWCLAFSYSFICFCDEMLI